MKDYIDSNSDSNIRAYDYGNDYIIIEFKDGSQYKYTYVSAGSHFIEKMKRLADHGDGLNSFINKNRPGFAKKY